MESPNIEPPNKSNHSAGLQSQPPPVPSSFSSLPEDIVVSCLARISRSYYPKLSLVCNSFRCLVLSARLYKVRHELETKETCVFLGLESPTNPCRIWYSLWIKPDHQTITQDKSTGYLLAPVPSSYSCRLPYITKAQVGSEIYVIGRGESPSSDLLVYNLLTRKTRQGPSMMVARKQAFVYVVDEKIYVMGGCGAGESSYWGELFDPKTQTWEPLPDPGPEVRFSSNKKFLVVPGKIYVVTKKNVNTKKKNFVLSQQKKKKKFAYLLEENKWKLVSQGLVLGFLVDDVTYNYADKKWRWRDEESNVWRLVKGLTGLDAYLIKLNDTETGTYDGKLVLFWDTYASSPLDQTKQIWCAVVMLDKSVNGEIWGHIEWVDIVCTVPLSYTLVRCATSFT